MRNVFTRKHQNIREGNRSSSPKVQEAVTLEAWANAVVHRLYCLQRKHTQQYILIFTYVVHGFDGEMQEDIIHDGAPSTRHLLRGRALRTRSAGTAAP